MATTCDSAERVRADDHCVPDTQLARPKRDLTVEVQAEEPPRLTPSAATVLLRILLKAANDHGIDVRDAVSRQDGPVRS